MSTSLQDSAATYPALTAQERQRCEIWTRVMGYHRPVALFNIGKQGEFQERKYFREPAFEPVTDEARPT